MKNENQPASFSHLAGVEEGAFASDGEAVASHPGWFDTTHWSVILGAGEEDPTRRMEALERLCQTYWPPVYAFIRQRGQTVHDAQDLTQTFFAQLLARRAFQNLDPRKGKFRSFLLVVLRHFLVNEAKRAHAAKRGGGQIVVPLEPEAVESLLLQGTARGLTPEQLFDRHWALTVLDRAFASLRAEFERAGDGARFEELKPFLSSGGSAEDYTQPAARLGITPAAVKVAAHRLRHRYGELLRREVAHTVESPLEIEGEMRYLLELVIQ
ncbi:MAG TPA: sigma-70 family RNA polymerase sigma factor [Dongiaceae bacterium]|nr:sigma-70 family RNA polymerase sigma factor [Dongiaceae bacterium]